MKFSAGILSIALLGQAAAFAPPSNLSGQRRTKTIRHAGIEDFVSEKVAGISDAFSSVSTSSPELSSTIHELTNVMLQALPAGVDEQRLQELFAAATTPYHLAVIGVFAVASSIMLFINSPDDYSDAPFEPGTNTYDPKASDEFYSKRPLMVVKRILKLATLTGAFNTGILFDWLVLGKLFKDEEYTALKRNEPRRAKQSLVLCEQLGPTFISTCTSSECYVSGGNAKDRVCSQKSFRLSFLPQNSVRL